MARVSFTVRSLTAASGGSFLRGERHVEVGENEDSALRQDRLQLAPQSFDVQVAYLEALVVEYGEVYLAWGGIPTLVALTPDPQITTTLLVFSELGPPQTIAGGVVLAETSVIDVAVANTAFSFIHSEAQGVHPGHWAYYSLFGRFQSSAGDDYYERLAAIEVLPPINYGSTDLLYERIPPFYQEQDNNTGERYLYKFLSIFGFDMDRMRTLLDYLMTSRDPALADVEALDALAQQMASMLQSSDLGTARLRKFMNDIGYFGRAKGTPASLEFWAKSLTNGDVKIDQTTHHITLFSERVNYVTNPKPNPGPGRFSSRAASPAEANLEQALAFSNTSFSGTHPYTPGGPNGTTFQAAASISYVMVRLTDPVPIHTGDHVDVSVQIGIGAAAMKWARLVTAGGLIVGATDAPTKAAGYPAFDIEVETGTR